MGHSLFKVPTRNSGLAARRVQSFQAAFASNRSIFDMARATFDTKEKMVQQLDIIHAVAEKQGLDFNFLLADLSQQAAPWFYGMSSFQLLDQIRVDDMLNQFLCISCRSHWLQPNSNGHRSKCWCLKPADAMPMWWDTQPGE